MAAGDILLDADGDRILDADGDVRISDGTDSCCCSYTPCDCAAIQAHECSACLVFLSDCTPQQLTLTLSGVVPCSGCVIPSGGGFGAAAYKLVGDPNQSWCVTKSSAVDCSWTGTATGLTIEAYSDEACTTLIGSAGTPIIVYQIVVTPGSTNILRVYIVGGPGGVGVTQAVVFLVADITVNDADGCILTPQNNSVTSGSFSCGQNVPSWGPALARDGVMTVEPCC